MNTPTPEQIAKLPKWAQEHIENLDRRVVCAERALREYNDSETPSDFYYEQMVCIGEGSPKLLRHYVQTNRITIVHADAQVDVLVRPDDKYIEVSWTDPLSVCHEIAMVPKSNQQVKIVHPKHMRQ